MDRRSFVKGSALGAAAVAAASVVPAALAEESAPEAEAEEAASEAAAAPAASASATTPAWLGAEPEVAEADIVETKETTLLIIGAGTSGLACAATAADMGLDFFLAEKLPVISESREYFGAVNTAQQLEAGLEFDKGMLLNELSRYASGKCDRDVIKMWIDESAEAVAWYTPHVQRGGRERHRPRLHRGAGGRHALLLAGDRDDVGHVLHPAHAQ